MRSACAKERGAVAAAASRHRPAKARNRLRFDMACGSRRSVTAMIGVPPRRAASTAAACLRLVSYRLKTTRPPTTVTIGAPLKLRLSKGEFRDLLGDLFTSYVHSWFSEKIVKSAGSP